MCRLKQTETQFKYCLPSTRQISVSILSNTKRLSANFPGNNQKNVQHLSGNCLVWAGDWASCWSGGLGLAPELLAGLQEGESLPGGAGHLPAAATARHQPACRLLSRVSEQSKAGLAVWGACLPSTSRLFSLNSVSSRRRYRLSLLSLSAGRFGWKEKNKIKTSL